MNWRPHTEIPVGIETALIAIPAGPDDDPGAGAYLAAEIYQWRPEHACWFGERNGLKIKHAVFWWLPEEQLLRSLPR